ncbi:hypothetical protein ACFXJ5_07135 [Streptomyces sp. NPDC059373]
MNTVKVAYRPLGLLFGAVFATVKATVDRGGAAATRSLTGTWPG